MAKQKPVPQTLGKDEAKPKQELKAQINPKAKQYKNIDTSVKYRYACPLCTNVAFKSVTKEVGKTDKICASCGKIVPVTVEENYIAL